MDGTQPGGTVIVAIGIDQVEIDRMRGLLARRGDRARERLFTRRERSTCGARSNPAECLAARFAAKEAVMKALGTGWGGGVSWTEIEVVTDGEGSPSLRLSEVARRRACRAGVERAHVSCTHEAGVATAMVVLEG